jgi:NAD(P)-dependent dehydrogenase (short-subunit alcohol dehydrogenase family)
MYNQPMLKENCLKGKTIIVTGGGTGLGKSMSQYFSELGANVAITSRRLDVLQQTAADMEAATGNPVLAVACDVRDMAQVEAMLATVVERFGQVDVLLNNAAGNFVSPTERLSHRAFEAVIGIVLQGTANCTLACGKYWIDNNIKGNILNIVTTYAWTGTGYTVPSACAKAGVLAMTRSLAVEWGRKYGIRANAIAPGPFPTKGAWERLLPGDLQEKFSPDNRIPLKRVGDHQELANLAAYLVSDFSAYINGDVITIDGGEWLQGAGQFSDFHLVTDEMWDMLAAMRGK